MLWWLYADTRLVKKDIYKRIDYNKPYVCTMSWVLVEYSGVTPE